IGKSSKPPPTTPAAAAARDRSFWRKPMHSSVLIGRKGVPVICRNLLPSELRTVIQPDNDREEFLLLLAEEQHLRAVAAEQLGEDYDDSDDDELIGYKLSLAEKVERAERQVGHMLHRMDSQRERS